MEMGEQTLEMQLHSEGFRTTYVWQDAPGAFYPEHTHATETAHIILSGEMTLVMKRRVENILSGRSLRCSGRRGSLRVDGTKRLPMLCW